MSFPSCRSRSRLTAAATRLGHPAARFRWIAVWASCLLLPSIGIAEIPGPVARMLANAPVDAEARCSYTRFRLGDEVREERFQAGTDATPWTLVSVDGDAPSTVEQRHYERGQEDRDRRHPLAFDLRDMVDPEHWELLEEAGEQAVYGFRLRPNEDLDETLVDKVLGTLVLDTVREQPVRIVIENTEPAYVAPFVRVAEYRQQLDFEWNDAIGAAVLTRRETVMRGRALGLKLLRKDKLVRYQDYHCAPAPGETVAAATD
jgi:hypothetical protein